LALIQGMKGLGTFLTKGVGIDKKVADNVIGEIGNLTKNMPEAERKNLFNYMQGKAGVSNWGKKNISAVEKNSDMSQYQDIMSIDLGNGQNLGGTLFASNVDIAKLTGPNSNWNRMAKIAKSGGENSAQANKFLEEQQDIQAAKNKVLSDDEAMKYRLRNASKHGDKEAWAQLNQQKVQDAFLEDIDTRVAIADKEKVAQEWKQREADNIKDAMLEARYGPGSKEAAEQSKGTKLADATREADKKWAKEHPDLDNQGEKLPLGQRVKNWFKSGPVSEAENITPTKQQKLKESLEAKHKGKIYSNGTTVGGKSAAPIAGKVSAQEAAKEAASEDFAGHAFSESAQGKMAKLRGAVGGDNAVEHYMKTADKLHSEMQALKGKEGYDTAKEIYKNHLESGPGMGDYIYGNGLHYKAAGIAIGGGILATTMGDGRRSNAQLYSSPF